MGSVVGSWCEVRRRTCFVGRRLAVEEGGHKEQVAYVLQCSPALWPLSAVQAMLGSCRRPAVATHSLLSCRPHLLTLLPVLLPATPAMTHTRQMHGAAPHRNSHRMEVLYVHNSHSLAAAILKIAEAAAGLSPEERAAAAGEAIDTAVSNGMSGGWQQCFG